MSRFKKLSHTVWHCQYHLVWTPKYRYKVLHGPIKQEVENCIRTFSEQKNCEIIELNVQIDHVHRPVATVGGAVDTITDFVEIPRATGPATTAALPLDNGLRVRIELGAGVVLELSRA